MTVVVVVVVGGDDTDDHGLVPTSTFAPHLVALGC